MRTKTQSATVEVNVMDLFGSIDRKLDALTVAVGLKASSDTLRALETKVTELEVHGSNNAQRAAEGVNELEKQISGMGWKIAGALAAAALSLVASVVMGLMRFK